MIVEDDKPFLERLSRAMETRGFTDVVRPFPTAGPDRKSAPAFAVVDLRLGDGTASTWSPR